MRLLSPAHTNAKTAKNAIHSNYHSAILHLAPFNLSGYNVCPAASNGCAMACLNTAGRGAFSSVQNARIRKTKLFYTNRSLFMSQLIKDITSLSSKAKRNGQTPVVRLNGTSDIDWENIEAQDDLTLLDMFPNVQFYDYTKRPDRIVNNDYPNYHLTFSMSEVNQAIAKRVLAKGFNVAVVFKTMPKAYLGRSVISGDEHDLRFLDRHNVIIGLTAKGKAKKDTTGFVK